MKAQITRLDSSCNGNWDGVEAPPVAILNTDSTLHDRIAYCYGLGGMVAHLADLCRFNDNSDIQRVGALLHHQIQPLMEVLHVIGSSTHPDQLGGRITSSNQ